MKITKFVHSCFLVEHGPAVLFDPGVHTWDSGYFNFDQLSRIDKIVITHTHVDHCHPEFVQALIDRYPQALIIASEQVQQRLRDGGVRFEALSYDDNVAPFEATHASLLPWSNEVPQNLGYHLFDKLTNPGDSLEFYETSNILAMPIVANWLSLQSAVTKVLSLANPPQTVFAVHDWSLNEQARSEIFSKCSQALSVKGINFIALNAGQSVDI